MSANERRKNVPMSTKIFDLYRYTGGDMCTLLDWLKSLRTEYVTCLRETLQKAAPRKTGSKDIDRERLLALVEHCTKIGTQSPYNIDASVCIYVHNHEIYVHFFCDQRILYDLIENSDDLIDCHYQNQSDQPADVSDVQWDERRQLIEALGIDHHPPSRVGMVFIFADAHDAFPLVWQL